MGNAHITKNEEIFIVGFTDKFIETERERLRGEKGKIGADLYLSSIEESQLQKAAKYEQSFAVGCRVY